MRKICENSAGSRTVDTNLPTERPCQPRLLVLCARDEDGPADLRLEERWKAPVMPMDRLLLLSHAAALQQPAVRWL
jgi:hypothetical protein